MRGLLIRCSMVLGVGACCAGIRCGEDASDTRTVLRVSDWGSPAVESVFMTVERELKQGFEKLHPGVRVRKEQIPGPGQYAPKLCLMHVAGCAPDVMHLDVSSAAVFIDNGVLLDLAPLMAKDPTFDRSLYFENVLNMTRRGDAIYSIPLDFTPMMIFYNRAMFDRAGLPYPRDGWTWDEFLAACKALTIFPAGARRPQQYGYNFENVLPFWLPWLWTNGGDILDSTGTRASGHFDGPASVEAIQFLADLMLRHRVAPNLSERAALGGDAFLNAKAAMDLKGHWMLIDYRARGLDVGAVSLPTRTGSPTTVIYASGLAITRNTRHPDLAWEYIKYMTSTEVQIKRVASGLAISGNRRAAAHYAADPNNQVEHACLRAVEYARPPWGARVENFPQCESFGEEMMEDILYGTSGVQQAATRAARLMDAVLTR